MRSPTPHVFALAVLSASMGIGCERDPVEPSPPLSLSSSVAVAPELPASATPSTPRPISSPTVALSRSIQASKLRVPLERGHQPRLVFGRGVLGQLTEQALVVYDLRSFQQVATVPLEEPRAVLALADGALLAIGARAMLHYEPGNRRVTPRVRPGLLWGDIYADAQQRDRIWVFDGDGSAALGPPKLSSFTLVPGSAGAALPGQTIELSSPRGGSFGVTREGVWVYLTAGRAERLSPGGLRLPGLVLPDESVPGQLLPARRLDQCLLIDETGALTRALAVPPFKRLGTAVKLSGTPYSVAVGDEGRLLAATIVTGAGPRFELELLDGELRSVARVDLPSDEPSGDDDWLRRVTRNQGVAASRTEPLVAVGGPSRVMLVGAQGQRIFFKTSQ